MLAGEGAGQPAGGQPPGYPVEVTKLMDREPFPLRGRHVVNGQENANDGTVQPGKFRWPTPAVQHEPTLRLAHGLIPDCG
jgi:hypothetical protein